MPPRVTRPTRPALHKQARYRLWMRIRFYSYFHPPCIGGGERILERQSQGLAARGHDVSVHTSPFSNLNLTDRVAPGTRVEHGVVVHRHRSITMPFSNPFEADVLSPGLLRHAHDPADLRFCLGYPSPHLWALDPQQAPVIAQSYVTSALVQSFVRGPHTRRRHRLRAQLWAGPLRRRLTRCQMVLADGPGPAKALWKHLGLTNVHAHIGMAIDPEEFVAPPTTGRAQLGIPEDARLFLAPHRVAWQKGGDLLLKAAIPLLHQHPDVFVAMIGPVNDPDLLPPLRRLQREAPDQIVLSQLPRPALIGLMKTATAMVLPSRGETVGGVVLEAMAAQCPVIVSDQVEAARDDYLEHEENGLMFPSEDILALRALLERALVEDLSALTEQGQRLVHERFTWDKSLDRLEALMSQAMERRATPR